MGLDIYYSKSLHRTITILLSSVNYSTTIINIHRHICCTTHLKIHRTCTFPVQTVEQLFSTPSLHFLCTATRCLSCPCLWSVRWGFCFRIEFTRSVSHNAVITPCPQENLLDCISTARINLESPEIRSKVFWALQKSWLSGNTSWAEFRGA